MVKKGDRGVFDSVKDLIPVMKKKQIGNISFGSQALGITYIPTGHFGVDRYLLGGIPEGKINVFSGIEGSLKTVFALKTTANAQKKHPNSFVVWIDAELCFDKEWALKHGVDLDRIIVYEPLSGEDAVDFLQKTLLANDVCLVVVDSLQALIPEAEETTSTHDMIMAPNSKLQTRLVQKINKSTVIRKSGTESQCTVILIGQMRKNLSMGGGAYKAEFKNPSAQAVKHFEVTDILFRRKNPAQKDGSESGLGNVESSFNVVKAKFGMETKGSSHLITMCKEEEEDKPYKIGEFTDYESNLVARCKEEGLVSGIATITETGETFRSGAELQKHLRENPDVKYDLASKCIAVYRKQQNLPPVPRDGFLIVQREVKDDKREEVRTRKKV